MPKTLQETVSILSDFVNKNEQGHKVQPFLEKIVEFSEKFPFLSNAKVYSDYGYYDNGNYWAELLVEDEDGHSSIVVSLDENSCIELSSGEDREFDSEWDEILLTLENNHTITLVNLL